jgi:hypothetical protein
MVESGGNRHSDTTLTLFSTSGWMGRMPISIKNARHRSGRRVQRKPQLASSTTTGRLALCRDEKATDQ